MYWHKGFLLISLISHQLNQLTSRHCTKQPRVLSPLGASGHLSRHMDLRVPKMGRFSESSEDFCKLRLQQVEVSCDDNQTCTATCSSASVSVSSAFQCIPVLYLSWSFHLGVQPGLIFAFHSCHSCAFHGLSVVSPEVVESAVSVVWGSRLPRQRNFRRQNSKTADISGRKILEKGRKRIEHDRIHQRLRSI